MATEAWYGKRERGSALGMRIVLALWRLAGRRVARLLLHPIVLYFYLTDRSARAASRDYLNHLHRSDPEALGSSPGPREVYRHFRSFAGATIDRVGFWDSRSSIPASAVGLQHILRWTHRGQGVLLLGSHLGSFDVMRRLAEESPVPVTILMYTRNAEKINSLLRELEPEGERQTRVVEIRQGSFAHGLEARKSIAAGEVVAVLADRVAPGEAARACEVEFLGGSALLPEGPFRLAAVLRCPVVTMTALRQEDGSYRAVVEPFADAIVMPPARRAAVLRSSCQAYADHLAAGCRSAPFQWFNFFPYWQDSRAAH